MQPQANGGGVEVDTRLASRLPNRQPAIAASCMSMKRMIPLGVCLFTLSPLGATALSAAELTESTFTQVVNDVSVITPTTKEIQKAALKDVVKSPQLVRTGPNSRAELVAADQTLTRIGANTLFSFDSKGRNINLQQGSILFHSPTGKGGGTIKTGGASAAVLGTTIVIVATPNGGFKGIVLEGKGRFTLPSGNSRDLTAGQLLYVLPGSRNFGPTLDINLGKMVEGSGLVKGYAATLPSMPKVQAAVSVQASKIEKGQMEDTGMLAGDAATEHSHSILDADTFNAALNENRSNIRKTWEDDATLSKPSLPQDRIFSRSVADYPKSSFGSGLVNYALLGEDIKITTPLVRVPALANPGNDLSNPTFGIVAKKTFSIRGDTVFTAPSVLAPPNLVLGGDDVNVKDNSNVFYDSDRSFLMGSYHNLKLTGGSFQGGGNVTLISTHGDISTDGTILRSGSDSGSVLTVSAANDISIKGGSIVGNNVLLKAGTIAAKKGQNQKLTINGANFWLQNQLGLPHGNPASISMEADTVVLSDVNFSGNSIITLKSLNGQLADNPNTGKSAKNGYVNFIRNVRVDGDAAQKHISYSTTDHQAGTIYISKR